MAKFNNDSKGNNRGGNRSNNGKRKPINSTTYVKSFDSFDEAISDMIANNDVVGNILCGPEGSGNTEKEIYDRLCALPAMHTPNPETRENVLWGFSISTNRVSIKTDQYTAFGWNIISRRVNDHFETTYNCRISIIGDNAMAKKALEDAGWNIEEKKNNVRN